jgi:L-lactate dehydrogenase complex protein LldG
MTSRAEFLGRLRKEMGKASPPFVAAPMERPAHPGAAAESVRRQLAERWPEALDRFCLEFDRVGGVFHRATGPGEVARVVEAIARERGAGEVVAWDPGVLGMDLGPALRRAGLSMASAPAAGEAERFRHREEAARAGIGVTAVDFALAETGTLVLISGAGRPRSTSLLPETHVAVFSRDRLLESLEQLGIMLEALHGDGARSMGGAVINLITGPSRTADIELTLTRGVHGPKFVHAVFVEPS